MNDGFSIGVRVKFVPSFIEALSQFLIIVYLAVEENALRFVGVPDRLLPARKIDDRQSSHCECGVIVEEKAILIRPSMKNGPIHCLQNSTLRSRTVFNYKSGNSAH